MVEKCLECKSPIVYKFGLCEKCYGELFEIAKENKEVGNKKEL